MNQPSKCKTRNWVKTNHESRGNYNTSSIKFRASMIGQIYVITVMYTYLLVGQ